MPHIYGRIDWMYLGSDFHRFWAKSGRHELHPDDAAYLGNNPFTEGVLPCPFDGPLEKARVVICLANPNYAKVQDKKALNDLLVSMRSGEEKLPELFADFYRRITGPIGLQQDKVRELVAVLNVCPYLLHASFDDGSEIRGGAGYTQRGNTVKDAIEAERVMSLLPKDFTFGLGYREPRDTTRLQWE